MNTLVPLFQEHFARYPAMQPQDAVKLLYQNEFGGGHLISDETQALQRLMAEQSQAALRADIPCCESIGNGRVRLNLAAEAVAAIPPELIVRIFAQAAKRGGDQAAFLNKLELLRGMAQRGEAPFSADALDAYLAGYRAAGYPMVSHSETYRAAYQPAYRVIDAATARLVPLLARLAITPDADRAVIVCLDGRCTSGKTTMAERLHELTGAGVVHMDDFFLPPELRTPERLAEPGGNVHYERFLQEVLPHLADGETFSYHRFDCSTMEIGGKRTVPASRIRIVEGAYSCHPAFGDYASLRIFCDVAPDEQLRRVTARDGLDSLEAFRTRWIPMEEAYIAATNLQQKADLVL